MILLQVRLNGLQILIVICQVGYLILGQSLIAQTFLMGGLVVFQRFDNKADRFWREVHDIFPLLCDDTLQRSRRVLCGKAGAVLRAVQLTFMKWGLTAARRAM